MITFTISPLEYLRTVAIVSLLEALLMHIFINTHIPLVCPLDPFYLFCFFIPFFIFYNAKISSISYALQE